MGQQTNMLFPAVSSSIVIPEGFTFASITPNPTATYQIQNASGIAGFTTSPILSGTFSFPLNNNIVGYSQHTITVLTGAVAVAHF